MRDVLSGYYQPSATEFQRLWDEAFLVPDTNVLLHAFRYQQQQASEIIAALKSFGSRLWLPYQAALEFQRQWRLVHTQHHVSFQTLKRELMKKREELSALFLPYKRLRIWGEHGPDLRTADRLFSRLQKVVDDAVQNVPDAEDTFQKITNAFDGHVGKRPPDVKLDERTKAFERRKRDAVPPGFRDEKAGDYFIWCEIMDLARENNAPVIFVTDDQKNDWWLEHRGQKIGPHPELREEFFRTTGQQFYAYTPSQFLTLVAELSSEATVTPETLRVIQEGERAAETTARVIEQMSLASGVEAALSKISSRTDIPAFLILAAAIHCADGYLKRSAAKNSLERKDAMDQIRFVENCILKLSQGSPAIIAEFNSMVADLMVDSARENAEQWLRSKGVSYLIDGPITTHLLTHAIELVDTSENSAYIREILNQHDDGIFG